MKKIILILLIIIPLSIYLITLSPLGHRIKIKIFGKRTVTQVLNNLAPQMDQLWAKRFPKKIIPFSEPLQLLVFKEEKKLEVWLKNTRKHLKTYKILAASGTAGPKLKRGDRQVPEGLYKIEGLNPNSRFLLSMKLNYPHKNDLKWAQKEKRRDPGDNIFIHGKNSSIGCVAIGNDNIKELFYLVAKTGYTKVDIAIAPWDFAKRSLPAEPKPLWMRERYHRLKQIRMLYSPK